MEIVIKLELSGLAAHMAPKEKEKEKDRKVVAHEDAPTEDEIKEAQDVFGEQIDERHIREVKKRRRWNGEGAKAIGFNAEKEIGLAIAKSQAGVREEDRRNFG